MKKITLYNFRCFENFEWDFTPGINLIVGDNSSGKTSLLRACRLVAGSFFAGFSDENTVWPGPEAADFRDVIVDGVKLPVKAIEIQFLLDAEMYPDIDMAFKRGDDEIAFNPSMANPYFLRKIVQRILSNLLPESLLIRLIVRLYKRMRIKICLCLYSLFSLLKTFMPQER